jgi:DNA-binding response OmpR family regulator
VAEDDEDIRLFIALVLERAGFATESYDNGADALSAARRSPADAYVLDRRMPGMSGLELCRQLRADPLTEHTAIMVVSAETTDLAAAAMAAGADAYLPKPFSPAELLAKIEELIARSG